MEIYKGRNCNRRICKRRIFAAPLLLLMALMSICWTGARPALAALGNEYRPVEQAVTRVMRAAEKVVAKTPYQFDAGICFGVAVVRRGDFIQSDYPLQKGVNYVFFAGGDAAAQNIDLELKDTKGKVLARDVAADAIPAISYVPKYTGTYRLALRLKKSRGATSFCSLIVMRRSGGYALPLSTLREVATPSGQMPAELKQFAHLLSFHRVRNEWAIYGAVLKEGDATALSGLRFESGRHLLGAFSDGRATDIDLFLSDGADRRVAESTDGAASPAVLYQTNGNQKYKLTVANRKSKGASLIFIVAFDVTTNQQAAVPANTGARSGARPVGVYLDSEPLRFEGAGAVEINGHVMVPLRGVFEALDADVEYDAQRRIIAAQTEDAQLVMQVGVAAASVNGETIPLSVAPLLYDGRVLVPLRFIAEVSGASVRWDAARRLVIIESDTGMGMDDD